MVHSLSVVTVTMNRTEHLLRQARAVSMLRGHEEHVILDLGSTTPISREQLPGDERIQLHRIESPNRRWWLTHSYNLAFALARGDYVLKLDADILPSQTFIDSLSRQHAASSAHLMCNRLTLQDWSLPSSLFTSNGLFLCKRSSLAHVRGFNPYIQGWGWDEIDLYSRLFLAGFPASRITQEGLDLIGHDDDVREPIVGSAGFDRSVLPWRTVNQVSATTVMLAQNEKNRQVAIASIKKQVEWPSLEGYAKSYAECSRLPCLPLISLFDSEEKRVLSSCLVRLLLRPAITQRLRWRLEEIFGFGPYAPSRMKALLNACGIDLGLVA